MRVVENGENGIINILKKHLNTRHFAAHRTHRAVDRVTSTGTCLYKHIEVKQTTQKDRTCVTVCYRNGDGVSRDAGSFGRTSFMNRSGKVNVMLLEPFSDNSHKNG